MALITTVRLRMLRQFAVYRKGDILPIVPLGQAREWIRMGYAEEVKGDLPAETGAAAAASAAIESAAASSPEGTRTATVQYRHNRRK